MTNDLATTRREAIARFLDAAGKSKERFFLRWDGRDSFFDDQVQAVLLERRPPDLNIVPWQALDYPIQAWQDADGFRLVNSEAAYEMSNLKERMCGQDSGWFLRLMTALDSFRTHHVDAMRNPKRTLDKVMIWRTEHYLMETSILAPSKTGATRINEIIRHAREDANTNPDPLLGAPPVIVIPRLESPRKYGESLAEIDGGAARKAVHDENKRRKAIMEQWAPCWLAHLRLWPMEAPSRSSRDESKKATASERRMKDRRYQKRPKK